MIKVIRFAIAAVFLSTLAADVRAAKGLRVAISPDIPPYVMDKASSGLEVDLLHGAFPNVELQFVQLPYGELQTAVEKDGVDVSVGVQELGDGAFYSDVFVAFSNYAITKKAAGLQIRNVADLAGHAVYAWQDAYLELGKDFEQQYAPGSPQRRSYKEFANQEDQVRQFWESNDAVIVIDRNIFDYFTHELGHSTSDVELHAIFPDVTSFRAAFKDAVWRDKFDEGLQELCRDGSYSNILASYHVVLEHSPSDEAAVRDAAAQFYAALNAMFAGDLKLMKQVWSHADDVTYMGPDGSFRVGWKNVLADWEKQAAKQLGGKVEPAQMQITVGHDIAVVHNLEKGSNVVDGKRQEVSIRATNIFRKEDGAWRMIGHHTDLLPFLDK